MRQINKMAKVERDPMAEANTQSSLNKRTLAKSQS